MESNAINEKIFSTTFSIKPHKILAELCKMSNTNFCYKTQPAKLDLNKKSLPKQKTIQNFTIDAQAQQAEAIFNKFSDPDIKSYPGLISMLQEFQKCIA